MLKGRHLLRDWGFCIVPDTNSIVFESTRQFIFSRKLEHFCLSLAKSVYRVNWILLKVIKNVLESTLELVVEPR